MNNMIREGLMFKPSWNDSLRYVLGKPAKKKILEEGEENNFPIHRLKPGGAYKIGSVLLNEAKMAFEGGHWIVINT